jgi:hypothetical protein
MGRLGENCYSRAMATDDSRGAKTPEGSTASSPAVRPIAGGETWSVTEIICNAGPGDRAYEERHQGFSISAVLQGCFTYRSDRGESLLYPGALLLGANRSCYECGHEHSAGDRCISFNVREDAFEDIASIASSRRNNPLSRLMLPASNRLAPLFAAIERVQDCVSPLKAEELLIVLFEAVVAALNDGVRSPPAPAGWEVRRIVEVLRSIEEHPRRGAGSRGSGGDSGPRQASFPAHLPPIGRDDPIPVCPAGPNGGAPRGVLRPRKILCWPLRSTAALAISRPSTPAFARRSE